MQSDRINESSHSLPKAMRVGPQPRPSDRWFEMCGREAEAAGQEADRAREAQATAETRPSRKRRRRREGLRDAS